MRRFRRSTIPFAFARARHSDPADWRLAPVAGLWLPPAVLGKLMEARVDTAGELWPLSESGSLRVLGLSPEQCRAVAGALDRLRAKAGDPSPRRLA